MKNSTQQKSLPVRDCSKECAFRPLHLIMGDTLAIANMERENPNYWIHHARRRNGKTAKDHARSILKAA